MTRSDCAAIEGLLAEGRGTDRRPKPAYNSRQRGRLATCGGGRIARVASCDPRRRSAASLPDASTGDGRQVPISSVRALGGDVGREGRGQFTGNPWDLRLLDVQ